MAEEARWYVAHTYSGYENTVKATIEKAVENRNMGDLILEVNIPMETVTEVTDNGPKTVERKVFPGYVLVKMVMTDETWHLVRNVRGVTGFVGSGNKPIPLTEAEIASLGVEKKEVVVNYAVGDNVRSPTAHWSLSWASWKRSTWNGRRSGSSCPCSAGRPRWSWTWIKSNPSDPARFWRKTTRGRGRSGAPLRPTTFS